MCFNDFTNRKTARESEKDNDELLIPENLFEILKKSILLEILFCQMNEEISKGPH